MTALILLIGILFIVAIIFVVCIIYNTNKKEYELYVFRHGEHDTYYDVVMFNNKNKEWEITLCKEQYNKISSVFNILKSPHELYAYLRCDKTTSNKIKFYIDYFV